MVPQEIPNRKVLPPPPFVYHPELFPELAKNNPEPLNLTIPKAKPKHKRNPTVLKAKVVENP